MMHVVMVQAAVVGGDSRVLRRHRCEGQKKHGFAVSAGARARLGPGFPKITLAQRTAQPDRSAQPRRVEGCRRDAAPAVL